MVNNDCAANISYWCAVYVHYLNFGGKSVCLVQLLLRMNLGICDQFGVCIAMNKWFLIVVLEPQPIPAFPFKGKEYK